MAAVLFSWDNEVVRNLAFYTVMLGAKTFGVVLITDYWRRKNVVFANPEDRMFYVDKNDKKEYKTILNDENVERARRNHLNDLENIPTFIFESMLYVLLNPNPTVALWHFRLFFWARVGHTISYQLGLQPWRGYFWLFGATVTGSIGTQLVFAACGWKLPFLS